jgi:hypothetical protein
MHDRLDQEAVQRLSKDLRDASRTLSDQEVRFLVDGYYSMQKQRIVQDNRRRAMSDEPHAVIDWFSANALFMENQVKAALDRYSAAHPLGEWTRGVTGIGPVIAAGLLAHIDIRQAPTVGHIWRFAGLDPTLKWGKGKKRPYNAGLKVLCVAPGMTVSTERGHVPIECVNVGDKVLTHAGRWRAVTKVFVNDHDGPIYGLRAANCGNQVAWLTGGHPVYAAPVECWRSGRTFKPKEDTRAAFDWHAVENVKPRWRLSRPIAQPQIAALPQLVLHGVERDGMVAAQGRWAGTAAPRATFVPAVMDLDSDMLRLLGLYVTEGHVNRTSVQWQFLTREQAEIQFVATMLRERFGLLPWIRNDAGSTLIGIGNKPLADALSAMFGTGPNSMQIPTSFLSLPKPLLQSFFDGLLAGDGDHTGRYAGKRLSSSSGSLARQYVDIARRLGLSASLHRQRDGHAYRVHVNNRDDTTPNARTVLTGHYHGPVYNLEVEEDHSYVVEGYAVHNCWKLGESFKKFSGHERCVYGHLYLKRKAYEVERDQRGDHADLCKRELEARGPNMTAEQRAHYQRGHLPPGRLDLRATRYAVKQFLSDLHAVWYAREYGSAPPLPYPIAILGHAHVRKPG